MNKNSISLTLFSLLAVTANVEAQVMQSAPRLVVCITIDQLRNDYLGAFSPLYGGFGFKKIIEDGMLFSNVSYPFNTIDRASASATLATGTTPYYNSIVASQWLDRSSLRPVYCVDDDKCKGLLTTDKSSPKNLSTSTLGDELKVFSQGKALVYSIAPFRDAAILSAGHAADGAFWIDDETGEWCSTDYYSESMPEWVEKYNSLYPALKNISGQEWTPGDYYTGNFSYFMGDSKQKTFRHKFNGDRRYIEYKASALVNENVTRYALHCVNNTGMGKDGVPDLLNITYYAGNFDHRTISECQLEMQDTYVRLDTQIAELISALQLKLGERNVLFVITSTGYSDEEITDYAKYRVPTGIFYINRTASLLNMYYGALYGQGTYVETCFGLQIFLNHKLLEDKRISLADATQRAQEFLCMCAGVRNVYTSQQLLSWSNELIDKERNGFNPERCGDILVEVAPGWRMYNENNLQTQLSRASYIPFPIIIYGGDTKKERVDAPVTTDRIAPTIAKAIRIRAPNACSAEPLF